MKFRRIFGCLSLTRKELLIVSMVVVALEFLLNLWVLRLEYTSEPNVFIAYWGFPLEAIKVRNIVYSGIYPDIGVVVSVRRFFEFLWLGIAINLLIYVVLSVFLLKVVIWARDEVEHRRYDKTA